MSRYALRARRRRRVTIDYSGKAVRAYGHSMTAPDATYVDPSVAYPELVKAAISGGSRATYGINGAEDYTAAWTINRGHSFGTGALWPIADTGVALLQAEYNTRTHSGSGATLTAALNSYEDTVRMFLVAACTATRVDSASATVTGTWTTGAANQRNYATRRTTGVGNTVTWSNVASPTGRIYLIIPTFDTSEGAHSAAYSVTVNGTVQYTETQADRPVNAPSFYVLRAIPLNVTPGSTSNTITVTATAITAGSMWVESLRIPQSNPTRAVVISDHLPTAAALNYATHVANREAFHTTAQTVVSEFSHARRVDLRAMDGDTSRLVDDKHPNAAGHAYIRDLVVAALTA